MRKSWIIVLITALLFNACKSNPDKADPITQGVGSQITLLTQKIKEDPKNPNLYFARAQALYDDKAFGGAVTDLEKAITLDSTNLVYFITLSDLYVETGDGERAIETLEAGLHFIPDDLDLHLELGSLYLALNQFKKSEAILNDALAIDKMNPDAWFYRGVIAEETGDTSKGIRFFKRAVELDPEYFDAYNKLGIIATAQKDPSAILYFRNALRVDPKSEQTMLNIGHYYRDIKDFPNALLSYREIVIKYPQNEQVHKNIAYVYLELDSLDLAYRAFNLATKFDPINADNFYGKGVAAEKRADARVQKDSIKADLYRAKEAYENVLGLDAEDVQAYERIKIVTKKLEAL